MTETPKVDEEGFDRPVLSVLLHLYRFTSDPLTTSIPVRERVSLRNLETLALNLIDAASGFKHLRRDLGLQGLGLYSRGMRASC